VLQEMKSFALVHIVFFEIETTISLLPIIVHDGKEKIKTI